MCLLVKKKDYSENRKGPYDSSMDVHLHENDQNEGKVMSTRATKEN